MSHLYKFHNCTFVCDSYGGSDNSYVRITDDLGRACNVPSAALFAFVATCVAGRKVAELESASPSELFGVKVPEK